MMVANCNALVESLKQRFGEKKVLGFSKSLFLGIAYEYHIFNYSLDLLLVLVVFLLLFHLLLI